jgi:hypothetical protein
MIPGTWLKWNVSGTKFPIWFRFISQDQYGTASSPGLVVYRLSFGSARQPFIIVSEKFIDALSPAEKGDHPAFPVQRVIRPILPDAQPRPPAAEGSGYLEWVRRTRAQQQRDEWMVRLRRAAAGINNV